MWRPEIVEGAIVRHAGTSLRPALWFVHALGDSSLSFVPLFSAPFLGSFELLAPDLPGAGGTPGDICESVLDSLAGWLARAIQSRTPAGPIGLVGHSLGAPVAVRAARLLGERVAGVFSIEGNLTEADAYLSGHATASDTPEAFHAYLLRQVRAMAETDVTKRSDALWRYHASLNFASPEAVWALGRSAHAASAHDGLGDEYRALDVPSLYYWSRDNTPLATQHYLTRHRVRNLPFSGGHWPMVEAAEETAATIGAFFTPLMEAHVLFML
jgi:pimeloyl-ACP methyl ester carboxylesterase